MCSYFLGSSPAQLKSELGLLPKISNGGMVKMVIIWVLKMAQEIQVFWHEAQKTGLSHQVWSHRGSTFEKNMTLNGHFSRPAETDPYGSFSAGREK